MIKRFNHGAGLSQCSGIVDHEISLLHLVRLGPLGGNPLPGLLCAETVALLQPCQLGSLIDDNHQNQVDPVLCPSLEKQRCFINNQVMGCSLQSRQATLGKVGNSWVRNRLEASPCHGVGKGPLRQGLAIEASCRGQDLFTKSLDQLRQRRAAWVDDLAGKEVGADQDRTAADKKTGNGTFT